MSFNFLETYIYILISHNVPITPRTGFVFYVTCVVFTVNGTKDITIIAIHTRSITPYVKIEGALEIHEQLTF